MKSSIISCLAFLALGWVSVSGQEPAPPPNDFPAGVSVLLAAEGRVEVARDATAGWTVAQTNQVLNPGDRVRTGRRSRATIRLSDLTVLRVKELTTLEIRPAVANRQPAGLDVNQGSIYLFNRGKPGSVPFRTPIASGAIRGTEFNLQVADNGGTELTLLDGEVALRNEQGEIVLNSGEQAVVEPGRAPRKTAVLNAVNVIQWVLYYPGVLDAEELALSDDAQQALQSSLAAYRSGDLLAALERYPENRRSDSVAERVYHAALLLAVGDVGQAESMLADLNQPSPLADALRTVIAAVKYQPLPGTVSAKPATASQWLAQSYYQQSRADLPGALQAAHAAVKQAPNFGFAWERLAELEFGFGRIDRARSALVKALALSPRNAQAVALQGFLLAAQNQTAQARAEFDRAIALDGANANAWLGRGLIRIRQGDGAGGREDLQVAATLEPNRAVLRSYLGKAFSYTGPDKLAAKELELAQKLDPRDPTSWLYLALLRQQQNRINEGVGDLEMSKQLNDNRQVYRSRLLVDEDRAVRSANLAGLYRDAGMIDVSAREASRAVDYDYANYSAHLFLAESYDALRDPKLINLRYETPFLTELLVANLLAPVGANNLSRNVSQQEYSRLFTGDHLGVISATEYYSRGDWVENGSQYGTIGNSSYALDAAYRKENGYRPNNDLDQLGLAFTFKQQVTPADSVLFQATLFNSKSGDLAQYYNQDGRRPDLPAPSLYERVTEKQEPNLLVGYHHEWSPGVHTLFLAGRFDDTLTLTDPTTKIPFIKPSGNIQSETFAVDYRSVFEAYSTELQQIWQTPNHTTVAGGRFQYGWNDTTTRVFDAVNPGLGRLDTNQMVSTDLSRLNFYAYHQWQLFEPLRLTAGVSYDRLYYPRNIDTSPITDKQTTEDQVSPKAGLLWTPWADANVRAAYSQSLGGLFFDNSVRLEPVQLAGFTQAYRSLAPESVVGLVPGTRFETWGVGFDQRFRFGLYLGLDGELLKSRADRLVGTARTSGGFIPVPNQAGSTRQTLDYDEHALLVTVNQLLGRQWSLGARYRISVADLTTRFTELAPGAGGAQNFNEDVSATLHQLNLDVNFNHRCGFFATADAMWNHQSNHGYAGALPGDDFWQFNLFAGYRFLQRRAELGLGLLNVSDQDYRLNPLTLYRELPRERTLLASLRFYF